MKMGEIPNHEQPPGVKAIEGWKNSFFVTRGQAGGLQPLDQDGE